MNTLEQPSKTLTRTIFYFGLWFIALMSPSIFFLTLIVAENLNIVPPADSVIETLFILIPVIGFLISEYVVAISIQKTFLKVTIMVATLIGIAIQAFALYVVLNLFAGF